MESSAVYDVKISGFGVRHDCLYRCIDLTIAVAVLNAAGSVDRNSLDDVVLLDELGLDGAARHPRLAPRARTFLGGPRPWRSTEVLVQPIHQER